MASTMAADASTAPPPPPATGTSTKSSTSIFAIPQPIRSLFNRFPLQTYPPNALPACATTSDIATSSSSTETSALPTLYIFTSPDTSNSDPSPNPTCLKLQTYLRAANIPHTCISSSNHASPNGALPFLLPPMTASYSAPLTGEKIITYANDHADPSASLADVDSHPKVEAYRSLITQAIRPAWVRSLLAFYTLMQSKYLTQLSHYSFTTYTSSMSTTPSSNPSISPPHQSPTPPSSTPSALQPQPPFCRPPGEQTYRQPCFIPTPSPRSSPSMLSLAATPVKVVGSSMQRPRACSMQRFLLIHGC